MARCCPGITRTNMAIIPLRIAATPRAALASASRPSSCASSKSTSAGRGAKASPASATASRYFAPVSRVTSAPRATRPRPTATSGATWP